jgi:hypothetical protein
MWLLIKSKLELGTEQEYRIIEYYVPYCNKRYQIVDEAVGSV